MITAGLVLLGYLSGSIPFGLILVRMARGLDVRERGSGNIGATNVARAAGEGLGLLVLVLDALKGALPVLLAQRVTDSPGVPARRRRGPGPRPVGVPPVAARAPALGRRGPGGSGRGGGRGARQLRLRHRPDSPRLAMIAAGLVLLGYLSGSIPFGLILVRATRGVDVRERGSGNIGATNVARVAGKGLGVVVLVLDALKGALAVLLARAVGASEVVQAAVGLAAFAGHVAPPWLGFRGGKGVATALGVVAVLAPRAALAGALTYALVLALLRISSVGSLLAGIVAVTVAWLVPGTSTLAAVLTSVLLAAMVWTHRGNIGRLLRRGEPRV